MTSSTDVNDIIIISWALYKQQRSQLQAVCVQLADCARGDL